MEKHSPSHTGRECACRAVWVPKHGRKVPCGEARREVGETLGMLAGRTGGVETAGGGACADRIHMCLGVAAGGAVGKPRGRSAIVPRGRHPEWRGTAGRGRTLWARGRCVGAVGPGGAKVGKCVREEGEAGGTGQAAKGPLGPGGSGSGPSRPRRSSSGPLRGVAKSPGCAGGFLLCLDSVLRAHRSPLRFQAAHFAPNKKVVILEPEY